MTTSPNGSLSGVRGASFDIRDQRPSAAGRCRASGRYVRLGGCPSSQALSARSHASWRAYHPVSCLAAVGEGIVRRALIEAARQPAPKAAIAGIMDLGTGTALEVVSDDLIRLHEDLAAALHGMVQAKDFRPLRPHVTIQNKVRPEEARALQAELQGMIALRRFTVRGLGVYGWTGAVWQQDRVYAFRGRN